MDKTLLRELALQGDSGAMLAYGVACAIDSRVDGRCEAIAWCRSAGEGGVSFGHVMAAMLMQEEAQDPRGETLELLRQASKSGNSIAMYLLALSIEALDDESKTEEMVHWYKEAAFRSHARAACRVAALLESKAITAKGAAPYSAIEWYELAGRLGDAHAAFRLGEAYSEGTDVIKDDKVARHWFEVSAILGSSSAHRLLAFEYSLESSAKPDLVSFHEKRAEECYRLELIEQEIRRQRIRW